MPAVGTPMAGNARSFSKADCPDSTTKQTSARSRALADIAAVRNPKQVGRELPLVPLFIVTGFWRIEPIVSPERISRDEQPASLPGCLLLMKQLSCNHLGKSPLPAVNEWTALNASGYDCFSHQVSRLVGFFDSHQHKVRAPRNQRLDRAYSQRICLAQFQNLLFIKRNIHGPGDL